MGSLTFRLILVHGRLPKPTAERGRPRLGPALHRHFTANRKNGQRHRSPTPGHAAGPLRTMSQWPAYLEVTWPALVHCLNSPSRNPHFSRFRLAFARPAVLVLSPPNENSVH